MGKIVESLKYTICPDCGGGGASVIDFKKCNTCDGFGNLNAILRLGENTNSVSLPRRVVARIIKNLLDRRGIKWEIEGCAEDVKIEMYYTLENIVRECMRESGIK